MTSVTENRRPTVRAQIGEFIRCAVQPHATTFNLTVVALVGIISLVFGAIILLLVMVAANFNILNLIE